MYQQQGVVSLVSAKPFTDKWNKTFNLYSFQLEGDPRYYRTGKIAPPLSEGDNVRFVFEQKGNANNVDVQTIEGGTAAPVQAAQPAPAPAPPPAAAPAPAPAPAKRGGGNSRDAYWENKEEYDKTVTQPRISYAAAQKNAVHLVAVALQHDVLAFGNTKKADKLGMLVDYVNEVTAQLAVSLDRGHEILEELKSGKGGFGTPAEPTVEEDEEALYDA